MISSSRRHFLRQALSIYSFQALGLVAALLTSVLLARYLGPEGKGTVDLFSLLLLLIADVGMLGATYGFIYLLANRKERLAEIHGDALAVAAVLGVVGLGLAVIAPDAIAGLLGEIDARLVALGLAAAGFVGYSAAWSGLMFGTDHAPDTYRVQAAVSAITALSVGGLVLIDRLTAEAAIAIIAGLAVASAVVRFALARRRHSDERPAPSGTTLRAALVFGVKVLPARIANWLHFRVDLLVVSHIVGLAGVGVYAVSVRWAELLWIVGLGVQSAGVFRVASESRSSARAFAKRLSLLVLGLTASAGVVLIVIGRPLLEALYGPGFEDAFIPLAILVPGVVLWDASRVLSNYVSLNLGRPGIITAISLLGAIVNIVGSLLAVERWGINGAAFVTSLTYSGVALITLVAFVLSKPSAVQPAPEVQA